MRSGIRYLQGGVVRHTFAVKRARLEVRYKCLGCGKWRSKAFVAEHTVNPFNKDEQGLAKSSERVMADARAAAQQSRDKFLERPMCTKCLDLEKETRRVNAKTAKTEDDLARAGDQQGPADRG